MKTKRRRRTIWRIPNALWSHVQPFLPPEKPRRTRGRPVVLFRVVLDGILYVLRTGCQWKALPHEFGSGSTCHRRFSEWVRTGVFQRVWARVLREYDRRHGIGWRWQSVDSVTVKAPLGGRTPAPIRRIAASAAPNATR